MDPEKQVATTVTEVRHSTDSKETEKSVIITQGRTLPKWTSDPQPLTPNKFSKCFNIAYDVVICLLPLLLAIKAGLVIFAYFIDAGAGNKGLYQPSHWTQYLIRVNAQLVTLFPVILVTIVTTLMKRYALWKSQRGATVAELEQFQSSVSLPSTLKMAFLLRAFNYTSLVLAVIWAWSYLGSQAVSREYTWQDTEPVLFHLHKKYVVYQKADLPSIFSVNPGISRQDISLINSAFRNGNNLYQTSIGTYNGGGYATDGFGYALIPFLQQPMPSYGDDPSFQKQVIDLWGMWNQTGWHDVRKYAYKDDLFYSSVVGVAPYYADKNVGLSYKWVGSFTVNSTSYVWADCGDVIQANASEFPAGVSPLFSTSYNVSDQILNGSTTFYAWKRNAKSAAYYVCSLHQHNVDLKIQCDATTCYVEKIRRAQNKPLQTSSAVFADRNSTQRFLSELLRSYGTPDNITDEVTANVDIGMDFNDTSSEWYTGYDTTGSLKMSQLINSYLAVTQAFQYPIEDAAYKDDANDTWDAKYLTNLVQGKTWNETWPRAEAKGGPYWPQYRLSISWITLDFITCFVVFAAALAACWLRCHTTAPDIFGYVSSMTRDNPHVPLPDGGNTLSGVERARALKHVKVKVTDLKNGDEVGHIGIALAKEKGRGPLEKERQYI